MTGPLVSVLLFVGAAHAGSALGLSVAQVVNDPFIARRFVQAHGTLALAPRISTELAVGVAPRSDTGDWTALSHQMVEENGVAPDLSRIMQSLTLVARIDPVALESGRGRTRMGMTVGAGAVRTVDDLEALQRVGDDRAESTQVQVHPAGVVGIVGEHWWGRHGIRVDATSVRFIEVVSADVLEMKDNHLLGIGWVVALGADAGRREAP